MPKRLRYAPLLLIPVLVLSAESCPPNAAECLKLPNNHLILVFTGGRVSLPEAHVSKATLNQVVWMYVPPDGAKLSIQFKVPADRKPPFEGMNKVGNNYEPTCFQQGALSLCISGKIADDASYNYTYEYDQVITAAGKSVVKDAGIIIEK
jgi:hypothetical protein